jgi:hypothetical protein
VYPDPETFNPDRWLSPAYPTTYREPLTQYPNLNGFSQFGFGRRTCQGVPIVDQDLFLTMGGLAWAFNVRKKRDAVTGAEVPVHWNDFTPLLIAKPVKFEFEAVPRSEEKMELMRAMYEYAKESEEKEQEDMLKQRAAKMGTNKPGRKMSVHTKPAPKREQAKMENRGDVTPGVESDSDHDVLITVRDSSPEDETRGMRFVLGADEKRGAVVATAKEVLVPGAWAA